MDTFEIIGLLGSIASVLGLLLFFMQRKRRARSMSQRGSSLVHGDNNTVEIEDSEVAVDNFSGSPAELSQESSSIIIGSGNTVSIITHKDIEYEAAITITKHYRHLLEFSLTSTGGLYEILQLYIELKRIHQCMRGLTATEAMFFQNEYTLELVPTVRVYPLLPSTVTNTMDRWILKGQDIELFAIHFSWPPMTAVDIVVKADIIDHKTKQEKHLRSEDICLNRNGESITETNYSPEENVFSMSPYLYKLMTIPGFLKKEGVDRQDLKAQAYQEIAQIFNCDVNKFTCEIQSNKDPELLFRANVHPAIASRLIELAKSLMVPSLEKLKRGT